MFGKSKFFFVIFAIFFVVFYGNTAFALVKDTDLDGLSDEAEQGVYQTDPNLLDTDGDTISDGQEILDGTNPLDANSSKLIDINAERTALLAKTNSLPWIFGRASGIFAFMILSLVVINGLLISTRLVFRFLPPPLNYDMHHFLAWTALFAVFGHAASFIFDPYFRMTVGEAALPFTLVRPFTSALGFDLRWAVAFGTIALYGLLALGISSYFKSKIPLKWWRAIHYLSFGTYLMFLFHGVTTGTDTTNWWMLVLYSLSALLVGALTLARIVIAIRTRKKPDIPL